MGWVQGPRLFRSAHGDALGRLPAFSNIPIIAKLYPMGYTMYIVEVRQTETYAKWFSNLRDRQARARILARIRRLSLGNPGDVAPVGGGLSEMRIHYGPGYRVYFLERGNALVILLAGGTKGTQKRDIGRAHELAEQV